MAVRNHSDIPASHVAWRVRKRLRSAGLAAHVIAIGIMGVAGCTGGSGWSGGGAKSNPNLLESAVSDRRPDERRKAIEKLAAGRDAGSEYVVRTFDVAARTDPDTMVRVAAVRGLGKAADSGTVPTLIALLDASPEHPYENCKPASGPIRWEAAIVLGRLIANDAVSPTDRPKVLDVLLSRAERDVDRNVRLVALSALGCFADNRVPPVLVGALRGGDFAIQHRAQNSLERLTGQSFENDPEAWQRWLVAHQTDTFAAARPAPETKERSWWARLTGGSEGSK